MPDPPAAPAASAARSEDALDPLLIAWLGEEARQCPRCGYALTGLARPRCSECGQTIALSLRPTDGANRAFIAGVVGTAAPAGFALLVSLGILVHRGIIERNMGRLGLEIRQPLLATLIAGALLVGWIAWRRRLLRYRRTAAWAAVAGLLGVTLVAGPLLFWIGR